MLVAVLTAMVMVGSVVGCSDDASGSEVVVAAAADLRGAFGELAMMHEEATGVRVTLTFGSSGLLAQQVRRGAPFDVFASADAELARQAGAWVGGDSRVLDYAVGRLAVVGLGPDASLGDLAGGSVGTIAIANPEHAPYGRAAEQALRSSGVWEQVESRLVYAANVGDALQLVTGGAVDAAVVALALVDPATPGGWFVVDADWHDPIEQALVVTRPGGPGEAFADLVASGRGQQVLASYGFEPPRRPGHRDGGAAQN